MDSGAGSSSTTTTMQPESDECGGAGQNFGRTRKAGVPHVANSEYNPGTSTQRKTSPSPRSRFLVEHVTHDFHQDHASPGSMADGEPRERKTSQKKSDQHAHANNEGHPGDTDEDTVERKISKGLRKISDSIVNMMIHSHGHYYDGGHYPQHPHQEGQHPHHSHCHSSQPERSEGVGDQSPREKKVSRERKISRLSKGSDTVAYSHEHYSQQYPQHQHLRDNADDQGEGDEKRKISLVRKISDTIVNISHQAGIVVHPESYHHHHPHHAHPFHHPVDETLEEDPQGEEAAASGALADHRKSLDSAAEIFQSPHYIPRYDTVNPEETRSIGSSLEDAIATCPPPEEFAGGKIWPQVVASIAANMGAFAFGAVLAWSSTGIPSITDKGDLGEMSPSVSSWIGSIPTLGAVAACPFAGFALDTLGRRRSMLYLTVPFILGWLLIGFAQNYFMVLLGRFVTGFCGGCFSIAAPIFTAETADAHIRGGLGSLFDLLVSTGMLYIYVLGVFLSWRLQAFACAVIPLFFHVIMYFVPESPRYLVQRDKDQKAEKAISWLRGKSTHPDIIQKEINDLKSSVGETKGGNVPLKEAVDRSLIMPVAILIGIMFFTTLSGIDAVIAYTVKIFDSAGSTMDPKISTIIVGAVQMLASFPTAAIVDVAGRRILLMTSELVMTASLALMGLYFHMMRTEMSLFGVIHYQDVTWIPLASLILFIIGYSLGCGPLSIMMIGELLPNKLKGLTSCMVLMTRWFLAFCVTNVFDTVEDEIHDDGLYWVLACICFSGTFFVYFCVPETMGKSLAEIELQFTGYKQNNMAIDAATREEDKSRRDANALGGQGAYDNKIVVEC